MAKMTMDEAKAKLAEMSRIVDEGGITPETKRRLASILVDAMPDFIKEKGGVTNPDAVALAVDLAMKAGEQFALGLVVRMLSKPKDNHEFHAMTDTLENAAKQMGIPLYKPNPGDVLKEGPDMAPTQKVGAA